MKYKYFVLDKENCVTIKSTKSLDTLYKTCGYRKNTDFVVLRAWENIDLSDKVVSVSLWGKYVGKSNNINDAPMLKTIMSKTVYGHVVFVFTYDPDIFADIDMNIWEEFKEKYLLPSINNCCESDYTFEEEMDHCDSDENEETNQKNIEKYPVEQLSIENTSNELTYEPYYVCSDEE
tara:strand:- start:393 stop:923 length:531 start_codon:yes stop_codon:yes gene_type:complete